MKESSKPNALLRAAMPAALILAVAGCAQTGGTSGRAASTGAASTAGAPVSAADQKFMADIAQSNLAEIETGQLALSKSQNPAVRAYAQKMIDDHTAAQKELQRLADAKGVTLPRDTDLKHKAIATELKLLPGDTFDRQYLSQVGVTDHQRTHELLQQTQQSATDPDLRALARKVLPTVSGHLASAQQLTGRQ